MTPARNRTAKRAVGFALVAGVTALSLLASAQQQPKRAPAKPPAAPAAPKKPPPMEPDAEKVKDAGALASKEDRAPSAAVKDGGGGAAVEAKTLDGGQRVFRFGEVEVEGRLKSPQIVYFLRRVRAEFAAGDLGHRSFMRELSETKNEPGF